MDLILILIDWFDFWKQIKLSIINTQLHRQWRKTGSNNPLAICFCLHFSTCDAHAEQTPGELKLYVIDVSGSGEAGAADENMVTYAVVTKHRKRRGKTILTHILYYYSTAVFTFFWALVWHTGDATTYKF